MKIETTIALVAMALAMCGCSRPDADRTTSAPTRIGDSLSAPAAPAERGPIPPNANAAAPGTNAAQAFASNAPAAAKLPPLKGGSPDEQRVNVAAQEAAAKAPDTAAADAAKREAKAARY